MAMFPISSLDLGHHIASTRLEHTATLTVALVLGPLLAWLVESSLSGHLSASTLVDLAGIQWYWIASAVDMVTADILSPGSAWAIHVTSVVSSSLDRCSLISTSCDVIHALSWSTGLLRADVCPGRLSVLVAQADMFGLLSGQCSELCGALHGFMANSLCDFVVALFRRASEIDL
jgi:heme/copper-type cytochrome/quinol oxidase subunit 2